MVFRSVAHSVRKSFAPFPLAYACARRSKEDTALSGAVSCGACMLRIRHNHGGVKPLSCVCVGFWEHQTTITKEETYGSI